MIYTALTNKAMNICYEAHKGQLDKSGVPYVFHPMHLAEQMDDEISTIVALLHDVVEDSNVTIDDLRAEGFPEEAVEAVRLLTKNGAEDYLEYVRALKPNPVARKVKLADLKHNSNHDRLVVVGEKDIRRQEKYRKAIAILEE